MPRTETIIAVFARRFDYYSARVAFKEALELANLQVGRAEYSASECALLAWGAAILPHRRIEAIVDGLEELASESGEPSAVNATAGPVMDEPLSLDEDLRGKSPENECPERESGSEIGADTQVVKKPGLQTVSKRNTTSRAKKKVKGANAAERPSA